MSKSAKDSSYNWELVSATTAYIKTEELDEYSNWVTNLQDTMFKKLIKK